MEGICNYDYKFKTATYDIGSSRKMRLSSILKHQEQAGEIHLSEDFGLDYVTICENGIVFVLVNSAVKIHRIPTINEKITINTYNKQLKGLKFYRGYDWYDENGEKIVEGVSAFVLVDINSHKMVKPSAFPVELPEEITRENSIGLPGKTHIPKETELVGSKKVLFSMLDSNEHLNNTLYADFLADFVPIEVAQNVKGFTIDYVKEAKLGDKIEVYSAVEDKKIYLQGKCGEDCCFRASIEF